MADQPGQTEQEIAARREKNARELEALLAEKARREGSSLQEVKAKGMNSAAKVWTPSATTTAPSPSSPWGHLPENIQRNLANVVIQDRFVIADQTIFDDCYDEDEDDDYFDELMGDEDDYDRDLDEFTAPGNPAAHPDAFATGPIGRPIGEFELFRLAKMGQVDGFRNFEAQQAARGLGSSSNMVDNDGRNVLHYAADCGNVELCQFLVEGLKIPHSADNKGMTPYDIAIICRHEAAAKYLQSAFNLEGMTLDKAVTKFAPKPPQILLSKAVQGDIRLGKRTFWGVEAPAAPQGTSVSAVLVPPKTENFPAKTVYEIVSAKPEGQGPKLSPVDRLCRPFAAPNQVANLVDVANHVGAFDAATNNILGIAPFFDLGEVKTQDPALLKLCVLAGRFHIRAAPELRSTVLRTMLGFAHSMLAGNAGGVFFTSQQKLPMPPLCSIKYFRRCIDPIPIFSAPSLRSELFPEYDSKDTLLRADVILKGDAAGLQFAQQWTAVEAADEAMIAKICEFLRATQPKLFEVFTQWEPHNFRACFLRRSLSTFVKVVNDNVTDIIVLRQRALKLAEKVLGSSVVFLCCSTIPAELQLQHCASLARNQTGVAILFATPTCGLTEKDMRLNFFEEFVGEGEFLYAVSSSTKSAVAKVSPSSKVALPLLIA
jgi:hypothetical protein